VEKPRRQEQETASDEVTEVAPGVLRMQLPIDMPGLGHVNCYALEDERGIAIVDPGLPGEESWRHLVDRLDRSGAGLARVHTVIVTHSHPDHFGGAGRVRHEAGAELITHELFRTWWDPSEDETPLEEAPNPWRATPWAGEEYMPDPDRRKRFEEMRSNNLFPAPRPTRRVEDAEVVTLARREWVSMHTPGHTADHLCLFDPAEGVLLSGDHVLPTITPHISGIGTAEDPLAEFFASLDRMAELEGVTIALPAHGHPFTDLAGRAKAIRRHHEERLDKLREASLEIGGFATVPELSQHLFSPRSWGPMADSETYAHLEHLRLLGSAECRTEDGKLLYEVG
jgi:glyoxylase-like metal-dependent hydrolase (beta-lactamase superfamily II)